MHLPSMRIDALAAVADFQPPWTAGQFHHMARAPRSSKRVLVFQLALEGNTYSAVFRRIKLYSLYSQPLYLCGALNTEFRLPALMLVYSARRQRRLWAAGRISRDGEEDRAVGEGARTSGITEEC